MFPEKPGNAVLCPSTSHINASLFLGFITKGLETRMCHFCVSLCFLEIQKIVPFNVASRLKGLASTVSDWKVVVMAETAAAAQAVMQVAASEEATFHW